jgi:hypothetical protein
MKSTYLAPLVYAALLLGGANAYAQTSSTSPGDRAAIENDSGSANKGNMTRGDHAPKTFDAWDTKKHGYLTADDVKSDGYLRSNFARCNLSRDGHMSQQEYGNCHD